MSEPLEMDVDFEMSDTEMNMETDMNCEVVTPLRPATETTLGGIKVGENLSIAPDGTLSAEASPVVVDDTLIIAGAAADAKKTGDEISGLKEDLDEISVPEKNLFNKANYNVINADIRSASQAFVSNAKARTVWIECKPNTTYTVSKTIGSERFALAYGMVKPAVGAAYDAMLQYANNASITITTNATAKYLAAYVWYDGVGSLTFEQVLDSLQIEIGNTATDYEPYKSVAYDPYAREKIPVLEEDVAELQSVVAEIVTTGVNLFDKDHADVLSIAANNNYGEYRSNTATRTVWIECEPNTTYTVSKQAGTNFIVAYGSEVPANGAAIDGYSRYATSASITITTDATARYLSAMVWTTSDSITLEQMLATVQFEKGSVATDYEPYALSADDKYARSAIATMQKHLVVTSDYLETITGEEIFSDFENMTPTGGAVYNNGAWELPEEGGVSKTVNIVGGTTYLIVLGVDLNSIVVSDYSTNYIVNPLIVTLGNASLEIFAYVDANFALALTPTAASTGDVTFSVQCSGKLALHLQSISIKPVTQYSDVPITGNGIDIGGYDTNFVVGNGQKKQINGYRNVAIGKNAQLFIDTGYANTAVGYDAQRALKNGRANTAIGHRAQAGLTTGMYNNAIGTVSQGTLTSGCWNNALGNETQRDITTGCNNVAIGRRAQSFLTTGNHNIAIGAMTGFNRFGTTGGHGAVATRTASYQVLIGGEATQKSAEDANYLIAIGFQACGNEKGIAIGAMAEANGEKSVAIGYGVKSENDNEVVIGSDNDTIVLAGRRITFNQDGTVTWTSV